MEINKRANQFNPANKRASFFYKKIELQLPVDEAKQFGRAARERRVQLAADRGTLEFSELDAAGAVSRRIGVIKIDPDGYLLRDGRRYVKNGQEVRLGQGRKYQSVYVEELVEALAVKDIPIKLGSDGRAHAQWRGVVFLFSRDPRNLYYPDLAAGRLLLRVGYRDRIEVLHRDEQGNEAKLGTIAIKTGNVLCRGVRLTAEPDGELKFISMEKMVEELGVRERQVRVTRSGNNALVEVNRVRLIFPLGESPFRGEIVSGRMVCRINHRYVAIGIKDRGNFTELGRIDLATLARLNKARVRVDRFIPELGRQEKTLGLAKNSFYWRNVEFKAGLRPGDRYFPALASSTIRVRLTGRRAEIFVDGAEREFIGSFSFDERGKLLGETGQPVNLGNYCHLAELVPAYHFGPEGKGLMEQYIMASDYHDLLGKVQNGSHRVWLKRLVMLAADHLGRDDAEEDMAAKLSYSLVNGLENMLKGNFLSPDLKQAFAAEIRRAMEKALGNPALTQLRDTMQLHYRDILTLTNSGQSAETTE